MAPGVLSEASETAPSLASLLSPSFPKAPLCRVAFLP